MLTVEYRVNGQLIGATNILNIATLPDSLLADNKCRYKIEHFAYNQPDVCRTEVIHKRSQGFEVLVKKALLKVLEKRRKDVC